MKMLEPGDTHDGWRPAPRFAPLEGERVAVPPWKIPRMPTLGAFALARLARRMKMKLLPHRIKVR
jgi:hypothetical protein